MKRLYILPRESLLLWRGKLPRNAIKLLSKRRTQGDKGQRVADSRVVLKTQSL